MDCNFQNFSNESKNGFDYTKWAKRTRLIILAMEIVLIVQVCATYNHPRLDLELLWDLECSFIFLCLFDVIIRKETKNLLGYRFIGTGILVFILLFFLFISLVSFVSDPLIAAYIGFIQFSILFLAVILWKVQKILS